jgi:hypothetical protein
VINVPCRFDRNEKSYINEEVKGYKRKLNQITKKFDNALLINMASERHLFTKHGLHLNVKGKEIMVSKLIEVLPKILYRYKASKFIPLTCKNTLTKQIVILSENKSSQVGTINNN